MNTVQYSRKADLEPRAKMPVERRGVRALQVKYPTICLIMFACSVKYQLLIRRKKQVHHLSHNLETRNMAQKIQNLFAWFVPRNAFQQSKQL